MKSVYALVNTLNDVPLYKRIVYLGVSSDVKRRIPEHIRTSLNLMGHTQPVHTHIFQDIGVENINVYVIGSIDDDANENTKLNFEYLYYKKLVDEGFTMLNNVPEPNAFESSEVAHTYANMSICNFKLRAFNMDGGAAPMNPLEMELNNIKTKTIKLHKNRTDRKEKFEKSRRNCIYSQKQLEILDKLHSLKPNRKTSFEMHHILSTKFEDYSHASYTCSERIFEFCKRTTPESRWK